MPPSIEGITTSWQMDTAVSLLGSGFGATQGESVLVFYCENAEPLVMTPVSWSDGIIETTIPGARAVVGRLGWFAVRLEGEGTGAVSDKGTILDNAETLTEWPSGTVIWAQPGTVEAGVLIEVPPLEV